MNTFTAQELADCYQKVADGGVLQVSTQNTRYVDAQIGPNLSSDTSQWRIKPTKKVIDLSVLIESGIDCEFSDTQDFDCIKIGTLGFLPNSHKEGRCTINTGGMVPEFARYCRPRMNHKHAWDGGECPIEGFVVRAWVDKEDFLTIHTSSHCVDWSKIMYVEYLEVEHGYVMPWEGE
jgi:hypothetical protein